jgi:hypothetical protein
MIKTTDQRTQERIAALPACIRSHIVPGDPCWSYVPPGWHGLVERLHDNLIKVAPNYVIDQVKEKFGTLRFYIQAPYHDDDLRCIIVNHYEMLSQRTCMKCGGRRHVENNRKAGPRCFECRDDHDS